MAIRIKHRVWIHGYEDTAAKNKLFAPDAELSEVVSDGFDKCTGGQTFSVAAAGNENLNFGDITAVKGLWLKIDGEAKLKINGSSDEIQLRLEPDATAAEDFCKFFIEADISSLNVGNPGTVVMNGVFFAWGDPTP